MIVRVLFDIVHPADVHFFKHAVTALRARGHEVLLTSRVKDVTVALLNALHLPHRVLSRQGRGFVGLLGELLRRDAALLRLARQFRPDLLVGNNSPCAAHVGFMMRRPSIVFDDTEIHHYNRILYRSVVSEVHTPACYRLDLGHKQVRYPGHHTLAYLHPDHFRADPAVLTSYGLSSDKPYFLFRFVHWGAAHDLGVRGLSAIQQQALVSLAGQYGRVVVSAEGEVPGALQRLCLRIRPDDLHQVLAGAAGLIGESATMCSEAASLGRLSVLIDHFGRGYTDEIEDRYQLCVRCSPRDWDGVRSAVQRLCRGEVAASETALRRGRMLDRLVNVSRYQLDQIHRLAETA